MSPFKVLDVGSPAVWEFPGELHVTNILATLAQVYVRGPNVQGSLVAVRVVQSNSTPG